MARDHHLTIYQLARQNLREVASVPSGSCGFGALSNQMRRAAISVLSNISEGASSGNDRQFIRYLGDLGHIDLRHPLHDRCDRLGRSITRLISSLGGEAGGG